MNYSAAKVKNKTRKNLYYILIPIACVVLFICSFSITAIALNSESYDEQSSVYAIDKIVDKGDSVYQIDYYSIDENLEEKNVESEEVEISEFLDPESDNITISYFRDTNKTDNSFLNWLFHYDNNIYAERSYYITSLDRLKLEENGTTDILDLEDIINMDEKED